MLHRYLPPPGLAQRIFSQGTPGKDAGEARWPSLSAPSLYKKKERRIFMSKIWLITGKRERVGKGHRRGGRWPQGTAW